MSLCEMLTDVSFVVHGIVCLEFVAYEQTFYAVCGKMCGENNLKNGALEIDVSTTALPLPTVVHFIQFLPSSAMTEIIDFGFFPSYVLNYNTLCFEGRFVSHLQACFQNRSHCVVIIYTVMHSNIR